MGREYVSGITTASPLNIEFQSPFFREQRRFQEAIHSFEKTGIFECMQEQYERLPHETYPVFELQIPEQRSDAKFPSAIIRFDPQPLTPKNDPDSPFIQPNSSYIWVSRGVKVSAVDDHKALVYFMAQSVRTDETRDIIREGGWRTLPMGIEQTLNIEEQIKEAFFTTTPNFDDRIGVSPESLQGPTEKHGVIRQISYDPARTLVRI